MNTSLTAVLLLVGGLFIIVNISVLVHDRIKKNKHE